jgi:hypothetical protein
MSKKEKNAWERIDDETDRMKVPSGWLVRVYDRVEYGYGTDSNANGSTSVAITYVPDLHHSWTL